MVNEEHLNILKKEVSYWNKWRKENHEIIPDLCRADFVVLVKIAGNFYLYGFFNLFLLELDVLS